MNQSTPPNFPPPASAADFEIALRRGHGRAVLWLRQGDVAEDRELILRACRENWAFNSLTDSSRDLLMVDVVLATSDPEFYVSNLLQVYSDDCKAGNYDQLYELIGHFAAAGSAEAREAVYEAFLKLQTDYVSHYAEVLLDIDGLDGYRFAIQTWARESLSKADDFSEIDLLDKAEERFGADAVAELIEEISQSDPSILPYHASVKARHTAWRDRLGTRPPRPEPSCEELRQMIAAETRSHAQSLWANRGSRMDEQTARWMASDVLTETDPALVSRLLWLFGKYPFPGDTERLYPMAHGSDERLAAAAAFALAPIKDPRVRTLGLSIMQGPRDPWDGVRLLVHNFQDGDCAAMIQLVSRLTDAEELEDLGRHIRSVFAVHPAPEFSDVLTLLYEKGMCASCRSSVVECLAKLGPLTEYIRLEAPYDASGITRRFMAKMGVSTAPRALKKI
ncbi:MAG: hypothetical protein ABIY70_10565 [Capsulimonas sp.]|uniref:hypothetical protein n=1 Tax=Capsulimonas sp. TaxID=2494211 RepID=UPI003267C757